MSEDGTSKGWLGSAFGFAKGTAKTGIYLAGIASLFTGLGAVIGPASAISAAKVDSVGSGLKTLTVGGLEGVIDCLDVLTDGVKHVYNWLAEEWDFPTMSSLDP